MEQLDRNLLFRWFVGFNAYSGSLKTIALMRQRVTADASAECFCSVWRPNLIRLRNLTWTAA